MSNLEWRESADGYESNGYRIVRLENSRHRRWRLETRGGMTPWLGIRAPTTSLHSTVRDARDRAGRDERERIRRARAFGHLSIGIAASLILFPLVAVMQSLGVLVAVNLLLYIALRGYADAIGLWLSDAWGWTRDRGGPERLTWTGRVVFAAVKGLRRRSVSSANLRPDPSVIPLSPR